MNGLMASALVPLAPAASAPSACPSKNTAAAAAVSRRRRAMSCRAAGGGRSGGDDGLLWLPRRDMLTGLSGVAAGLVAYQGLANAAVKEAEKPCLKPDKVNEKLLDCNDPNREYPCPPQFQSPAVVDWSPASRVSRVRQPIHLLSREYQEKYKEAVAKMKALPAENPLSFAAQAAIHQAYCDGHYRYDPERKNAPFDVHFSWVFAPWHRMYIHFYERALGQLIGDDTFALPFWNWDTPAGMVVPPLFRDSFANPLFNKNRDQGNLDKLVHLDLKDSTPLVAFDGPQNDTYKKTVNDNLCTVNNQQIKQGKDARHFLGAKLCSDMEKGSSTQGSLERMAHTALHVWVGKPGEGECSAETGGVLMHDGVNYNCNNDMGFLATAGRDPLFYSHHCNIDRLWHVWSTKLGGKCFDDPEWLDASFVFYDNVEDPKPVRIRFRDVVDTATLGYTYGAVDDKDLPWLNCKFTSLVPHSKDKPAATTRSAKKPAAKFPMTLKKGEPVEFPAVAVPAKEEGKHQVLVIRGVTYDPRSNNKFDVAINVPREKALEVGPEHHEFAGSFQVVPSSKAGGGTMEGSVVLSIGDLLADIEAHGHDAVDVVIVPRTKAGIRLSSPPVIENH